MGIGKNKFNFQNSFKMKASVILGVFQMSLGVILSIINYKWAYSIAKANSTEYAHHFRNYLDMICNFIPQLLFLCCIFVYLCFTMFYKWIMFGPYGKETAVGYYHGSHCAPTLLVGLINMFMLKSGPYNFEGPTCFNNAYYPGKVWMREIELINSKNDHYRIWWKKYWYS